MSLTRDILTTAIAEIDKARPAMMICGAEVHRLVGPGITDVHVFCDRLNVRMTKVSPFLKSVMETQGRACGIRTLTAELFSWYRWRDYGFPVFKLTESEVSAFCLTDLNGLTGADLPWPFGAFLIDIPPGFWSMLVGEGLVDSVRWISVNHFDQRTQFLTHGAIGILIDDGPALLPEEDLSAFCLNPQRAPEVVDQSKLKLDARDVQVEMLVRKMVCAMALYISERGKRRVLPIALSKKQRRKQAQKAEHGIVEQVWRVGSPIVLNPLLVAHAKSELALERGPAFKLQSRFCVRGHYRRQACGPGRQERKLIYIQPFWKGPQEGERIAHVYEVGTHE